jgi:microcin C transport system substrate-binding protein
MRFSISLLCLAALFTFINPSFAETVQSDEQHAEKKTHALATHGQPKYPADFTHFDYVNPDAPKGGTLRLAGAETFDSLNNFISKGVEADGLGLLYSSLMESSKDESSSKYAALAEYVSTPEDRSSVTFYIRDTAKWSDGEAITAHDVVYSFNTITEKGKPFYKAYYINVQSVEALSDNVVKFTFDTAGNLELPLIIGDLPIIPKHYWEKEENDFEKTTLTPPVTSGPYKIKDIVPGRSITYVRDPNWWGKDLPVNKGRYNFEHIRYDYYRDQNVSLEALFANEYDFRQEYTAKLWATAYDAPPVNDGRIKKEYIKNQIPQGMQGFVMNLRRPVFQDKAVRKAMNLAFDYEWSNKQFAYGAYTRTRSYFQNSEMEAKGLPDGRELEILEPFRDQVPSEVFTSEWNPSKTDGSGNNRSNLRQAIKALTDAGYELQDKVRVHKETGVKLEFEFLVSNTNAGFERWFQPYKQSLERIGIIGNIRIVDASQYVNRALSHDFDLVVSTWGQSSSPGNEQREYWGSTKADQTGSRNLIGVKDPVVDALIEMVASAPTREELVFRTRALDRVLQHGWYVIPNWHIPAWRVAFWDKFEKPATQAPYALGVIDTWWAK